MTIQGPLQGGFLAFLPSLLLKMARVFDPSHSWQKEFWRKRNLFRFNQGSNTQPHNYQTNAQPINQFIFYDNSYTSKIILSRTMVKHITKIIK